jgi:hypothetical protein
MAEHDQDHGTSAQLLRVKKALGLSADQLPPLKDEGESEEASRCCINCGYDQHGQMVDRCPECGLLWAGRLYDPTPWSAEGATIQGWWETARLIWTWNRRIRIRTALVPATPQSQRFAKWAILFTTVALAMALGLVNSPANGSALLRLLLLLMNGLVGGVLIGVFLFAAMFSLIHVIRGTWRRRLSFVPASIHYACAWWPPCAAVILTLSCIYAIAGQSEVFSFVLAAALLGILLWGIWLWGSVTESGHVSHVAMRLVAVTLLCSLAGGSLLPLVPGSVRTVMIQALTRTNSNLASVQLFGTFGGLPVSQTPQTYALLVDALPSDDEDLILGRITELGSGPRTRVILRGKDCTLKEFARAFSAFRLKVRSQDRFIVYINGHGARNGAGSIRIEDGEITSMSLRSLLTDLPTPHCLVIIDSCFGGKFIERLRGCDAVILASTDDQDVAFCSSLRPFWEALAKPDADSDGDGQVTVKEAFWWAYRTMLRNGEMARQVGMERLPDKYKIMLDKAGYVTPQLEALGEATEEDFAVAVTPAAAR